MLSLDANTRNNKTKGELSIIRGSGDVPAIIYGGKNENEKISISKKLLKSTIEKENFLSNIIILKVNGKDQNVLPREVVYDVLTDEPIHVDFLRVVPGVKIRIEVPVVFINHEKSPGLKRGGVLNIVRRKVELKCPAENIPEEIIVDLKGLEIGTSIKISFITLPENVTPTIVGRDFVIATVAAPTIMKEPEKPTEGTAEEGAEGTEAVAAGAEGAKPAEGKEGDTTKKDDKAQATDKKQPEKK